MKKNWINVELSTESYKTKAKLNKKIFACWRLIMLLNRNNGNKRICNKSDSKQSKSNASTNINCLSKRWDPKNNSHNSSKH